MIIISYDYEGSTLTSLVEELKIRLGGRRAECIGFMMDGRYSPGTLNIVQSKVLSLQSLRNDVIMEFWKHIARFIGEKNGMIDIFWPLATTGESSLQLEFF